MALSREGFPKQKKKSRLKAEGEEAARLEAKGKARPKAEKAVRLKAGSESSDASCGKENEGIRGVAGKE